MISFDVENWKKQLLEQYIPNPNSRMREEWLDVTYPYILQNKVSQWLWKHVFCPIGFHLFDEVQSTTDHYLYCDACDFEVHISKNNQPLETEDDSSTKPI